MLPTRNPSCFWTALRAHWPLLLRHQSMKQQGSRKEKQLHKILSEMDPAAVYRLLNAAVLQLGVFFWSWKITVIYFISVDNTRKEITWSTYPGVFSNHCLMDWSMFTIWMLSKITQSIEKLMQKQVGCWQNIKFWHSLLPTSAPECIYKGAVPEQWHGVVIFISMSDGIKKNIYSFDWLEAFLMVPLG